jgi:hypothetical protein
MSWGIIGVDPAGAVITATARTLLPFPILDFSGQAQTFLAYIP